MESYSLAQIQAWLRDNDFEESVLVTFIKFNGKALMGVSESGIMSLVAGAEGVRLYSLITAAKREFEGSGERRLSLRVSKSVFAIAVVTEEGVQLTGNCFAVTPTHIISAYHNFYDVVAESKVLAADKSELSFFEKHGQNQVQVYTFGIISQRITRAGSNHVYHDARLVKYIAGSVVDDWIVFEVVSGCTEFKGHVVRSDPPPMQALEVSPVPPTATATATGSAHLLSAFFYDLHFYFQSVDAEEELICLRHDPHRVTLCKEKSNLVRVQKGLNPGCAGCPYIDTEGRVVALHVASLDDTAARESTARFRGGMSAAARDQLTRRRGAPATEQNTEVPTKFQKLTEALLKYHELHEEQSIAYDEQVSELSDLADTFTHYKEGFILLPCTPPVRQCQPPLFALLMYATGTGVAK